VIPASGVAVAAWVGAVADRSCALSRRRCGGPLDPLDQATDELGRRIDTLSVPTTPAGYQNLLA
jgi:hypothetical protein